MKYLLTTILMYVLIDASKAQNLFGFSSVGFKKYDLSTGKDTILIPQYFTYGYQGHTTSDHISRVFYIAAGLSSQVPDTLITVDVKQNSIKKDLITHRSLYCPQYNNSKLYGFNASGIVSYDLATNQLSVIDTNVKPHWDANYSTADNKTAFKPSTNEYIFMYDNKHSGFYDTIFRYNIVQKTLLKDTIRSENMSLYDFSPVSNQIVAFGFNITTLYPAIYKYDFATKALIHCRDLNLGGHTANVMTCDPVNNLFFFRALAKTTNPNVKDTTVIFNLSTNKVTTVANPNFDFNNFEYLNYTTTSVSSTASSFSFKIFPNPVAQSLKIEYDKPFKGTILIFDMNGSIVKNIIATEQTENVVDVSNLASGSYVLCLSTQNKQYIKMFIKE